MDALTETLGTARLAGSVICRSVLGSPWGISLPAEPHCGMFHFVVSGMGWLELAGHDDPIRLLQGDVVLLPRGDAHSLRDAPGRPLKPLSDLIGDCEPGPALEVRHGGDGPQTALLSGAYRFDPDVAHPVFSYLPPVLHAPAAVTEGAGGMQTVLRLLATELSEQRAGHQALADRLVDVLFIYLIRSWIEAQPEGSAGWMAAMRHPQVAEAICLLHRQPAANWTVESLAHAVGMSRSAFAREFKDLTGEPPLAYLTSRRIEQAAVLLRNSVLPLAQIAERIGYESEYSFGKAFKRMKGISPGQYRATASRLVRVG